MNANVIITVGISESKDKSEIPMSVNTKILNKTPIIRRNSNTLTILLFPFEDSSIFLLEIVIGSFGKGFPQF